MGRHKSQGGEMDSKRRVRDSRNPRDVASLLYVGRLYRALGTPFKASLKNRFLYLSHDDGWMLKLYARSTADVERMLEGVVGVKCRELFKVPLKVPGLGRRLMRL